VGYAVSINDPSQWQVGDLIFFGNSGISHVGIYVGNGEMLHALGAKYGTRIDNVQWYDAWDGGVRLLRVRRIL